MKGIVFFFIARSDRDSGKSDVCRCKLEVLDQVADLFSLVSEQANFSSQMLVSQTVLRELFNRHKRCTAVARRRCSIVEFCEHYGA